MNFEQFIAELNSSTFFKEFTFSQNKFKAKAGEYELADSVVWFGDFISILQLKEREKGGGSEEEVTWFKKKVLGKGVRQVKDSLRFINEHSPIKITNERGHAFDLNVRDSSKILKVIVYSPSANLPKECIRIRHYISKEAGFIHVLPANDYLNIVKTLQVPADIFEYFLYRESIVEKIDPTFEPMDIEPVVMGQYLSGGDVSPTQDALKYLRALIDGSDDFDLSRLLGDLSLHIEKTENPYDYYKILQEFSVLPRSMWREIKTRLRLSIDKVKKGDWGLPYRVAYPATDCAFMIFPVDPRAMASAD